jgi:hypothetical protein
MIRNQMMLKENQISPKTVPRTMTLKFKIFPNEEQMNNNEINPI